MTMGREYGGDRRVFWRVETWLYFILSVSIEKVAGIPNNEGDWTHQDCLACSLDAIQPQEKRRGIGAMPGLVGFDPVQEERNAELGLVVNDLGHSGGFLGLVSCAGCAGSRQGRV